MKKYLVTRELTEDFSPKIGLRILLICLFDIDNVLSSAIFLIVNHKDSSISDLILQHNIDLQTDILKYKPVEEDKE